MGTTNPAELGSTRNKCYKLEANGLLRIIPLCQRDPRALTEIGREWMATIILFGKNTIAQQKQSHTFEMSASFLTIIGSVYLTEIARIRIYGQKKSGRISLPVTPVSEHLNLCPHTPALLMQERPSLMGRLYFMGLQESEPWFSKYSQRPDSSRL